jgi:hypothetical protein
MSSTLYSSLQRRQIVRFKNWDMEIQPDLMTFWAIGRFLSERAKKPTQMKLYKILKSFHI